MNKQQLASKIWAAANEMRGNIEANDYKDYILGFIFYKFLSEKEVRYLRKNGATDEDILELTEGSQEAMSVRRNLGYFIEHKNLFSTWIKQGSDFNAGSVTDAMQAFARLSETKTFAGIFDALESGLSKLGDSTKARTAAISRLINLIDEIPMDSKHNYDVLGFIYEYLISKFAENAGKKAGEFYTPHEVSTVMSEIVSWHLKDCEEIKVYDPTSGSASLLINIGTSMTKYMSNKDGVRYYAQEKLPKTYNLTRMNLIMRDINPANIVTRRGDTLADDWPYFDDNDKDNTYEPLLDIDAVVANPPYSAKWTPESMSHDPRFSAYGIAPKTKADFAFLLHGLYHIRAGGIMTIVLPHGVLFRGNEEGKIRRNLIEHNNIDAIIGLPANIFFGTGIPTIIMVLKKARSNDDVLIIDASKGFAKEGKNNKLRARDIKKIVDTYTGRLECGKYSRRVSRDEIRENDYNLNIPRYVDSSEKGESWDIYASIFGGIPKAEIDELQEYWDAFPSLKSEIFAESDTPFSAVKTEDVGATISGNSDVQDFAAKHKAAFADFEDYLKGELIAKMTDLPVSKEEAVITEDIFARLSGIPLIDKYVAYQLLDDDWAKIETDLEIIQTEGFEATKKVDRRMVLKKVKGESEEIPDGWVGHVIPFEVVQASILKEQADKLKAAESKVSELDAEYSELTESFTDEDKEAYSALFDDDGGVIGTAIAKTIKEVKRNTTNIEEESAEWKIVQLGKVSDALKTAKREAKVLSDKLVEDTKATIENLTDEQVKEMLYLKWIKPLADGIAVLPDSIVSALTNKINTLTKKYSVTLLDVEAQIDETEKAFADMIDDLEGSEFDMKGLKELQKMLKGE